MAYTERELYIIAQTLKFTRDSALINPGNEKYIETFDQNIIPNFVEQLNRNGCSVNYDVFALECGLPAHAIGTVH